MRSLRTAFPVLLVAGIVSACPNDSNAPGGAFGPDSGGASERDAGGETDAAKPDEQDGAAPFHDAGTQAAAGDAGTDVGDVTCVAGTLDVLFMVDNSGSMNEEQDKLASELPRLVKALTSGDADGDGKQDFPPAEDLHLGVVSSDMGAVGVPGVPTCGKNNAMGDDGVLISASRSRDLSCNGFSLTDTTYQAFVPGAAQTPEQVAADFKCLATLGTTGCGFEQQLEAAYKAVAPQSVKFARHTGGHGDQRNAGFLRAGATFVTILVSDEEDCSITDPGVDLFIPSSTSPNVMLSDGSGRRIGLNLRCAYKANDANLVHAVSRYIDGFKALKPRSPASVIFAAIVGMPKDDEGKTFEQILADPRMRFLPDPSSPGGGDAASDSTSPTPACVAKDSTGKVVTSATPGLRFVKTAQGFGANGVLGSICDDDYSSTLDAIISRIAHQTKDCNASPEVF